MPPVSIGLINREDYKPFHPVWAHVRAVSLCLYLAITGISAYNNSILDANSSSSSAGHSTANTKKKIKAHLSTKR